MGSQFATQQEVGSLGNIWYRLYVCYLDYINSNKRRSKDLIIGRGCVASIVRMVIIIRDKDVLDVTWDWYSLDLLTLVSLLLTTMPGTS